MLQAIIDAKGIVTDINDWDNGVGIPCAPDTQIGSQWNGKNFVESVDSLIQRYDSRLTQHFNETAKTKKYDSWITCSLRAGINNSPFHLEGVAFANWMDECNVKAYKIMMDVLSGIIALPTENEFIDMMPAILWPK